MLNEEASGPQPTPAVRAGFLKGLGAFLFLGGVVGAVYFYAYFDTSVEVPTLDILGQSVGGGRVNNLGLMQDRQNGLIISIGVALVGLLLVAMGERRSRP